MIPIKEFYTESTPTYEELKSAKELAINENCVVHLNWYVQYNGWNDRYIYQTTDIEEMNNRLRHIIYGM